MLPSIGFSCDFNKNSQFYYNCIVKKISKCQSKSMMLTSKSPTLREYAALNSQKAAFLENEKDRLIREMMEREVMLKDYQVEYYLNKRYNELKKYFVLSK
jgi:hypothetical protein